MENLGVNPLFARLPVRDAHLLADLRLQSGLEIAEGDGWLWLRGPTVPGAATIPGLQPCQGVAGGPVVIGGDRVASVHAPVIGWRAIRDLAPVSAPPLRRAGPTPQVTVRLRPGGDMRDIELLLVTRLALRQWADHAASIRIRTLRIAPFDQERVLVRGNPLPSLPGEGWWCLGPLAIPLGQTLEPVLRSEDAERWSGCQAGELLLACGDGWRRLPEERWVDATRAHLRVWDGVHA